MATDVLLLTATKVETTAILKAFGIAPQQTNPKCIDGRVYVDLGTVQGTRVMMTQCEMGPSGLGAAQQAVDKSIATLSPAAVVMVGIAFGRSDDKQSIGDVLVTKQLRPYDLQRVGTQDDGSEKIVLRDDKPHASDRLLQVFRASEVAWKGASVQFGTILTGAKLVDNLALREELFALEPEAIGGEMEGAGLYVACQGRKVDWILVKAICDFADGHKAREKSERQALAATNAATFVYHTLQFVKVDWRELAPGGTQSAERAELQDSVGALIGQIPRLPPAFVGRDHVLRLLRERLFGGQGAAITALHGLPGVGKTTLAAALVRDETLRRHFRGGVLWAGLGPRADVVGALDGWAREFGADLAVGRDMTEKAKLLAVAMRRHAQKAPMLLVLDDVWAWEDVRPFVEAFTFPGCGLLCTTRDATIARRFASGPEISLGELSEDEAVALLASRCPHAMAVDPEGVRALANVVGGLPLGLSLIAGRLLVEQGQARWVREAISELQEVGARLRLEGDERPGTLQAIVEMSVTALDPGVREGFAKLGAFAPKPAGFEREAVLAVWEVEEQDEKEADGWLKQLVLRALLETAGEDRFTLHQVLADVAVAQLVRESLAAARGRHAGFYRALVEEHRKHWLRISIALDQIRWAWQWVSGEASDASCNDGQIIAYSNGLAAFFWRRGFWKEGLACAEQALDSARRLKRREDEVQALHAIGQACSGLGDPKRALECLEQSLAISRNMGDRAGEAGALASVGSIHLNLGNLKHALECFERALPILREIDDCGNEGLTLNAIGQVYSTLGDKDQALEHFERALILRRGVGDRSGEAATLNNMGLLYARTGQPRRALECYEQAIPILHDIGYRAWEGTALNNVGLAYSDLGEVKRALEYYERAIPILRDVGHRSMEATALNNIGLAYFKLGELSRALEYYERAVPVLREVGDRAMEATALNNVGQVHFERGEMSSALEHYKRALPIAREVGYQLMESTILNNIGQAYSTLGAREQALHHYKQALAIAQNTGQRSGEATVLNNIGAEYWRAGELRVALKYYEQALPILRDVGDRFSQTVTLQNMARVQEANGDRPAAKALLAKAVEIAEAIESPVLASLREHLEALRTDRLRDPSGARTTPSGPTCKDVLYIFAFTDEQ